MKPYVKWLLVLLAIGGTIAAAWRPTQRYLQERSRVEWETTEVIRGDMVRFVHSTGTIKPVLSVSVGSFVSGPIVELNVDFNDRVTEGEILAKIDPRLFAANVDRDQAILATRKAEVERIEAQLQKAVNDYERVKTLRRADDGFVSDGEVDQLYYELKGLEASKKVAAATVLQAQASLENSVANLNYCEITAPVDGVIIDRKIDPGQTLAATFQTPELFVVAPDLREKVHVFASVDEADIGLIQQAQRQSRAVTFTVDAHPDDVFAGAIEQIRVSSISTQNVVTYPVVIAAANPDLKLLPGMTANLSFDVDSRQDAIKVPNAALRFYPEDIERVCLEDRALLDGTAWKDEANDVLSAEERIANRRNTKRHVWVVDGELLRAIEIEVGLVDNRHSEILGGNLDVGDRVVTGVKEQ